jgi:hypothetical protein
MILEINSIAAQKWFEQGFLRYIDLYMTVKSFFEQCFLNSKIVLVPVKSLFGISRYGGGANILSITD